MYEELIKRLREKAGAFDYDGRPDIACDYEQAADAIEEEDMAFRHLERDYKELCAHLPKWIPATEILPEKDGSYLCWLTYTVYLNPGPGETRVCGDVVHFDVKSKSWFLGFKYPRSPKVLAWMPLPEPPKEST